MDTVALFTSLPPRLRRMVDGVDIGPDWQRTCIDSWRAAGCTIHSVNCAHEIDDLQRRHPDIRFLEAAADRGSPLPPLPELLRLMATHGGATGLYVNADIRLAAAEATVRATGAAGDDTILLGNRTDIATPHSETGRLRHGSFDVLAIGRQAAGRLDAAGYRLGEPWWDYWLPSAALLGGLPVSRLPTAGLHLKHDARWSSAAFVRHGRRYIAGVQRLLDSPAARRGPPASQAFAAAARHALQSMPNEQGEVEALLWLARRISVLLNSEQIAPKAGST